MKRIRDLMNRTSWGWIVALGMVPLAIVGCAKDDTDPPNGRSGMDLFTDAATGCQYLGFGVGTNGKAITPRIAADGKTHMGCKAVAS